MTVCEDDEFDLYVAMPNKLKKSLDPEKKFKKIHFTYDHEHNTVTCPNGCQMKYRSINEEKGVKVFSCNNYKNCKVAHNCSKYKYGRKIEISLNHVEMEQFWEKSTSDIGKKIIAKRKAVVEHPFGTIKRHLGFTYFTRTGIEAVRSEFHFISFIYNFKRVTNIVGVKKLVEIIKEEKDVI